MRKESAAPPGPRETPAERTAPVEDAASAPSTPLPSRRQALAAGAAAIAQGAAALAGGAAALGLAEQATAAVPTDLEQLERLLALEQRLKDTYDAALARDAIDPGLGQTLLEHEREHVRGLEQALRGRGRRSPRATVPPPRLGAALTSRKAFARFAVDLETQTVRAYQDVLTTFRNDRLLLPLGSIMTSAAQHVVALRQAAGEDLLAPA